MAKPTVDDEYSKVIDEARHELRSLIATTPIMLRAGLHDAATDGSIRNEDEDSHRADKITLDLCEGVKTKYPQITDEDLYKLAREVALEVTAGPQIFEGDLVKHKETGVIGVVISGTVLPISQLQTFPSHKEDLVLVTRCFNLGDIVSHVRDKTRRGVVVDVPKRVDLASDDGNRTDVSTEDLQRIRGFFPGDLVIQGNWLGDVTETELSVAVDFSDGSRLTGLDPDPEVLKPLYTNALERHLATPYHKGQGVVVDENSGQTSGLITRQKVQRVHVKWSSTQQGVSVKPPDVLQARDVILFLPPPFSHQSWVLGSRCLMDGNCYVVCNFHPTSLTVKWKSGEQELLDPRDVVLEDDAMRFFEGNFQLGYIVFRKEANPTLPHFGLISGFEDGMLRVAWEDDSTTMVNPEEIDNVEEDDDDLPNGEGNGEYENDENDENENDGYNGGQGGDEDGYDSESDSESDSDSDDGSDGGEVIDSDL